MRRVKAHGRKSWNCGWRHRDRTALNRGIERSFRQTATAEIEEGLDEIEDDELDERDPVDRWEAEDRDRKLEYELDLRDDAVASGLWAPSP